MCGQGCTLAAVVLVFQWLTSAALEQLHPSSGHGKQWAARDPGRGSTVGTVEVRGRQPTEGTSPRRAEIWVRCGTGGRGRPRLCRASTTMIRRLAMRPGRTSTHQVLDGWARAEAECGAIGPASHWIDSSQTRTWTSTWGSSASLEGSRQCQMLTFSLHLDLDSRITTPVA
jgi:hypothetical protein